jgi:hypothetical protein
MDSSEGFLHRVLLLEGTRKALHRQPPDSRQECPHERLEGRRVLLPQRPNEVGVERELRWGIRRRHDSGRKKETVGAAAGDEAGQGEQEEGAHQGGRR